ncbi:ribonuclease R [Meiothermus granaticius]|uniref:Ribonuclease R n=1 Tax=Meiothermus granaticius NBRC 107808 TaxID=1227551 RepID=A0A399FAT7_9DEIN|nr:ribonuclease R [Meiothermus granaticius]RIH92825.1 Ribonuclease R [Meiothermus granaticius NBRC 107808]GEM85539.1 ribonuclease R [Meiothermus granaticius NBRC 107808]
MTQPERILELFRKRPNKPHSLREILRSLRLDKPEAKEALELLVAEGKLMETKRRLYQLPEAKARKGFEARLQAHPSGFAFAIPIEAELPDLFIPKGYLGGAWHGDRIRAEAKPPGRDRRPWGAVTAVLERAHHHLIGRLFFRKGYALLHPDDPRLPDLKLRPEGLEGLEAGARISVRVQYPQGRKTPAEPYGEFQTFLGQEDTPEVETEAIIAKYELLPEFSPEALEQAEKVAQGGAELEGRSDFRGLRVFTIDGPDAKDFDDAIHVTKLENGNFQVGIHIADVSHYVEEFTPLDQEAYARATSVYLPGRVLPMLPERLSNGVCSLKPGEDRLVLSVLAELTPKGRVKRYTFHRGVIRSLARLTYPQVEALAQAREKGAGEAEALSSLDLPGSARAALEADLATLLDLTQTLKKRRLEEGALDFHFTEVKVEVGEEGELHLIPQQEPQARSLIEELMLLANRIVARHLAERGIPALFRVHEDPSEEALGKLVAALEKLGYRLGGGEPSPKALQAILNQAEGRPEAPAVSTLLLRSLRLARYAAENLGHFGLAAEHYLHFTSPIRRYPDLVVHRVLKTLLRGRISERHKADWGSRFPKIAEHTSERERAAESAERELTKYYQCRWAEARLGQRFPGVVSGVTQFGVFVTIAGGVEGMIRLGALEDDQYHYYEELLALEGVRTKRRIRIGDALEVQIQAANPAARQIDLVPTEKFYEEQPMDEQRSDRKRRTPPSGRAKAHSSKSEPKARGREAARPHKASRVVGPPDKKREFDKPVRATARKIYFGAWEPEAGEAPQDPARATPKAASRRRRGRGRRS